MNLSFEQILKLEIELKKRWEYPYHRWRKQNNEWDSKTSFVYRLQERDKCLANINFLIDKQKIEDKEWFFNYSANRWYNFRSAQWIENIFKLHQNVIWEENEKHPYIDFYIDKIPFDHKTSIYPKAYNKPIDFAKINKWDLINWLYENQSKEQRFHMKNRLFVIVHSLNWDDRKLKAELSFIKDIVDEYLANFSKNKLYSFTYEDEEILSDIIRIEK